jgi:hypothetical protein
MITSEAMHDTGCKHDLKEAKMHKWRPCKGGGKCTGPDCHLSQDHHC